ncbi:hypothetical protein C0992_007699 [Termitomyces sp. T32_za158]|nr:hypothetical protein C0992_007699 [Termitomyces sp. T32_za158]
MELESLCAFLEDLGKRSGTYDFDVESVGWWSLTGPHKAPPASCDPHQAVEENFIRNDDSFICAVKNYPSLADALIHLLQEARSQGPPAQATRFIGMTDLAFVDHFDFERIADQANFYGPLQHFQNKIIDRSIILRSVKLWNIFVDRIVSIVNARHAAQAEKARQAELKGRQEELCRESAADPSSETGSTSSSLKCKVTDVGPAILQN